MRRLVLRSRRRHWLRLAALQGVDQLFEIGLGITREYDEHFFPAGLLIEDIAIPVWERVTVETLHAVVAAFDLRSRKHRHPCAARSLADYVQISRAVGFDTELNLVARVEYGTGCGSSHSITG